MLKIYVDTNVYLDLFGGRSAKLMPLADFANHLFAAVREKKYRICLANSWSSL